jgi:hypothetical protein
MQGLAWNEAKDNAAQTHTKSMCLEIKGKNS